MRAIRNILFINVVIIILLHAIIPHRHHGEMSINENQSEHQKANNLFKVIGLAFHNGASNGLDNYVLAESYLNKKTDLQFNLPFIFNSIKSTIRPLNVQSVEKQAYNLNLKTFYILQSHGLRAPPCYGFYS